MRKFRFAWLAIVFLFVACGGENSGKRNGFVFRAAGVDAEDIQSIWVKLVPIRGLPDPDNPGQDLPLDSPYGTITTRLIKLQKNDQFWTTEVDYIYAAVYDATAYGYVDDLSEAEFEADDGASAAYASMTIEFTVQKGLTGSLFFILNEQTETPEPLLMPRFTAIIFDKEIVEQHETLEITLVGISKKPLVHFWGRSGAGSFDYHWIYDPPSGNKGDFPPGQNSAVLTWTPPDEEGFYWFVVAIEDEDGDIAEMGIWATVGRNQGDTQTFGVQAFNLAPIIESQLRILNDHDGTTSYIWLDVSDDRTNGTNGFIDYEWTWVCETEEEEAELGQTFFIVEVGKSDFTTITEKTRVFSDGSTMPSPMGDGVTSPRDPSGEWHPLGQLKNFSGTGPFQAEQRLFTFQVYQTNFDKPWAPDEEPQYDRWEDGCKLTVTVTDHEGASSTKVLDIGTKRLDPTWPAP